MEFTLEPRREKPVNYHDKRCPKFYNCSIRLISGEKCNDELLSLKCALRVKSLRAYYIKLNKDNEKLLERKKGLEKEIRELSKVVSGLKSEIRRMDISLHKKNIDVKDYNSYNDYTITKEEIESEIRVLSNYLNDLREKERKRSRTHVNEDKMVYSKKHRKMIESEDISVEPVKTEESTRFESERVMNGILRNELKFNGFELINKNTNNGKNIESYVDILAKKDDTIYIFELKNNVSGEKGVMQCLKYREAIKKKHVEKEVLTYLVLTGKNEFVNDTITEHELPIKTIIFNKKYSKLSF